MIEVIAGCIIDVANQKIGEDYQDVVIAHQCNCTSKSVSGLAKTIFEKWPSTNTYKNRKTATKPGTFDLIEIQDDQKNWNLWVANLYAQIYPGHPRQPHGRTHETFKTRQTLFVKCLDSVKHDVKKWIEQDSNNRMLILFPWRIGCGLAGGAWDEYFDLLLKQEWPTGIKIAIVKQ